MADQSAADGGPGAADPAPAVHIDRAALSESNVDRAEDGRHRLSATRHRHVHDRITLTPDGSPDGLRLSSRLRRSLMVRIGMLRAPSVDGLTGHASNSCSLRD